MPASIGISLFPQDGEDTGSLLRNAEAAMLESKKSGHAYVVSNRGALDSSAKLRFVTRLRKAVESQRWTLHYQPVLELETGRMRGVEALIRWIEPDGTLVPPGDFIPVAEDLGLIESIGDWVVRARLPGARVARARHRSLGQLQPVAPSVLAARPGQGDLERIREGGVDPARVIVEITETSAMADPDRAQAILEDLHAGGLRIAIDDFGTGYSSLARIRDMPVDVLKIDRSFVHRVDVDRQNGSIVSAFIELAGGLGVTTLAEGIETEGELASVKTAAASSARVLLLEARPPEDHRAGVRRSPPRAARGLSLSPARPPRRPRSRRRRSRPTPQLLGRPEPGMSVTPSETTRAATPSGGERARTASPRPPSTRWSSTTTSRPVPTPRRGAPRRRSA